MFRLVCCLLVFHSLLFRHMSVVLCNACVCHAVNTRTHQESEIANVNFYAMRPEAIPEFAEITQNNGHYAVQGHSRSPILVPIESSYIFLLVINSNLPPILYRFRDIGLAVDRSEIAILATPLVFNSPGGGVPLERSP